ncbi:hypothetical protein EDB86DRAFT_2834000 [Lactarius hatsudake]|nr:hypothetical protein EDB86DRAFT_2834000 [Lactarius hatsudake]
MLSNVDRLFIKSESMEGDERLGHDIPWLELFRPFTALKVLSVDEELSFLVSFHISLAPEYVIGDRATEVLPALELLFLQNQPIESMEEFVTARQDVGRPVTIINEEEELHERLYMLDGHYKGHYLKPVLVDVARPVATGEMGYIAKIMSDEVIESIRVGNVELRKKRGKVCFFEPKNPALAEDLDRRTRSVDVTLLDAVLCVPALKLCEKAATHRLAQHLARLCPRKTHVDQHAHWHFCAHLFAATLRLHSGHLYSKLTTSPTRRISGTSLHAQHVVQVDAIAHSDTHDALQALGGLNTRVSVGVAFGVDAMSTVPSLTHTGILQESTDGHQQHGSIDSIPERSDIIPEMLYDALLLNISPVLLHTDPPVSGWGYGSIVPLIAAALTTRWGMLGRDSKMTIGQLSQLVWTERRCRHDQPLTNSRTRVSWSPSMERFLDGRVRQTVNRYRARQPISFKLSRSRRKGRHGRRYSAFSQRRVRPALSTAAAGTPGHYSTEENPVVRRRVDGGDKHWQTPWWTLRRPTYDLPAQLGILLSFTKHLIPRRPAREVVTTLYPQGNSAYKLLQRQSLLEFLSPASARLHDIMSGSNSTCNADRLSDMVV